MFRCNECGSIIDLANPVHGAVIECGLCDIDLEVNGNSLLSWQLGPSEE